MSLIDELFGYPSPDLTNDAPRRRTEPAITVTVEGPAYKPKAFGVGDRVHYYGDPKWLGTVVALDSDGDPKVKWDRDQCGTYGYYAEQLTEHIEGRTFTVSTITAFTPAEVEAAKAHGSAAYACMAADIEQCRELLAVEEAKVAMEVWRLSNGEWLDWHTDSDAAGAEARETQEYREDMLARWTLWLAALTPPAEGATLGDWAAAQPDPPMKWSREYMQHLYDKLAKGEVVG